MKTKITLVIACFIVFVLCSTVAAYYPAMIVRECPHCRALVVQEDTLSGNTIGAKLYTDGKREAKMLPDHPALVMCPSCLNLFWVDEAVHVSSGFDAANGKPPVMAPSEKEILKFLGGPALPKDKEIYLRVRAWWAANDAWRWVPNPKPAFSEVQVKNLISLYALLDESEPGHRILKAEIARELGNFNQCLLLLSYQFDKEFEFAVSFIKSLALEGDRGVRPFPSVK
jgi:hypothetical protein